MFLRVFSDRNNHISPPVTLHGNITSWGPCTSWGPSVLVRNVNTPNVSLLRGEFPLAKEGTSMKLSSPSKHDLIGFVSNGPNMSWTTCSAVVERTLAHVWMLFHNYPRSIDVNRVLFTLKLPLLLSSNKNPQQVFSKRSSTRTTYPSNEFLSICPST